MHYTNMYFACCLCTLGASVIVTKVYCCKKSGDCNDAGETFAVFFASHSELYFLSFFANMTVYLTAKTKDFRALVL